MINITNELYITELQELGDRPFIGYHSIVTQASLSTNYETELRPLVNLWNPDTSALWEADTVPTNGEIDIDIVNAQNQTVNYIGLARHNFGSQQMSYTFQESDNGVDYTDVVAATLPADDSAIVEYFDATDASYFRLKITCPGSTVPYLAHLKIGEALILRRPMYVGHYPEKLARFDKRITNVSETGQYLGEVIVRRWQQGSVSQQNTPPGWVRDYLVRFIRHCAHDLPDVGVAQGPYFFAWRPSKYPLECIYGWTPGTIRPKNQSPNGLMEYDFDITGIA